MNAKLLLLVLVISLLIVTGCTSEPEPTPTVPSTAIKTSTPTTTLTPTSTATPVPTATEIPLPTPTEFPLSLLPGYFTFSSFDCVDICTNIGISRSDFTGYEILTNHADGLAGDPVWSPDGRYIAYNLYQHGPSGFWKLKLYDFVSQTEIFLFQPPENYYVRNYDWAPDSTAMILEVQLDNSSHLQMINILSKRLFSITDLSSSIDKDPTWSPSGDLIAFSSNREDSVNDDYDIWTVSPQGTNLTNLTGGEDDQWNDILPSWSPNGGVITFYRFSAESNGLWMMNSDGSDLQLLFDIGDAEYAETPVWAFDANYIGIIFGTDNLTNVWIVDPLFGNRLQINLSPGNYFRLSWSPDSIGLIYNEKENENKVVHLAVLQVDSPFSVDVETSLYSLTWSPVESLPDQ